MIWNLICSPFEVFWYHPLAKIWKWWLRRSSSPKDWCWVKWCWVDLKFNIEPFMSILRSYLGSNRWNDVYGVVVSKRVGFVERRMRLLYFKRCRDGMKFDVEPPSGILRPHNYSILGNRVSCTGIVERSCLATRKEKLGQMVLKWPGNWCVHFSRIYWRILSFLCDFEKIRFLK